MAMLHAPTAHRIDYATPLRAAAGSGYVGVAQRLLADLPPRWDLSYRDMASRATHIVTTAHAGRLVRIDLISRIRSRRRRVPVDRVVAVFGRSRYFWQSGDADAIDQFLARRSRPQGRVDGGDGVETGWLGVSALLETGSTPLAQRAVVTQMERHCAMNPGTFYFVRPVYGDASARPLALEYGVLRARDDLWVARVATGLATGS